MPPEQWSAEDVAFMRLALEYAASASGRVAPNPPVGAVLTRDGEVLAVGATLPPPGPHAEAVALAEAGEAARGATLYVTLEPCAHHGRTPPCADAIVAAGIRRVVISVRDPNPIVDGRGVTRLRNAGTAVDVGLLADEAARLIEGFAHRLQTGRPLVTVKYAMTLDGRIATRNGHARWISGSASRERVHILRDRTDAILIGAGTALADDPLLTTRLPDECAGYGGPHHPLRVILDTHARTRPDLRMLHPDVPGRTLMFVGSDADRSRIRALERAGAEVVSVPVSAARLDLHEVLDELGSRGMNDLLVEGGGRVHGAFFDARLVDRVCAFVAPVIVGGDDSPVPVGGIGVARMPDGARVVDRRVTSFGDDLCIEGRVMYESEQEQEQEQEGNRVQRNR